MLAYFRQRQTRRPATPIESIVQISDATAQARVMCKRCTEKHTNNNRTLSASSDATKFKNYYNNSSIKNYDAVHTIIRRVTHAM